jgi:tetratricopeptide (TPR) repeat protein
MTALRPRTYIQIALSLAPVLPAVAQVEVRPGSATRSRLVLQLSDALESFDRGSALLHSAPDEALTAFREAGNGFQAVVDAGIENGQLYYNLGNTHLRLGEIGRAIADYRRAQRLTPNDERLKANLRFARSLRHDHIETSGKRTFLRTVFFWHYSWPSRARSLGAVIGFWLFWVLLAIRELSPRVRLGYPAIVCLLVWVSLGASVAMDLHSRSAVTEGVLVANDVVVRKGNGEAYDAQFKHPLHEGVEFQAVEQRGGWVRLELADGSQGWVREHEVELIN